MRIAAWTAGVLLALPAAALIALAVVVFPPSIAVAAILGGAIGCSVVISRRERTPKDPHLLRHGLEVGVVSTLSVLALTGLVVAIGPAAGWLLLATPVLAAGGFLLWRTKNRPVTAATMPVEPMLLAEPEPVVLPELEPMETLPNLATDRLCLMWRRSYAHLEHATSHSVAQQTVAFRQLILDELERRDSDGFSRWLSSGARAAGNPTRYLTGLS